ncbi:hypothetical protein HCN_1540 [Helicobacter cinaedi PAGU611]|uniref:hypothetical protein n=1 Tax=Helicobacter cinaedi TaxID=213 RepID=UPI00025D3774|nr:hypothetical protein [Helicobacter cinaedi]AWK62172.1 hypothetical protein C6B36_07370 [Helicobacter cinaedi]QOQ95279.1 hypothetical protein HW245_06155 [Helicobacter cinaedi]BAM12736.1 hypothetical protein HCN_1540 [Helicobacter cinaedi PAGU611]BBB20553.1 membrane-associated zinc metalloprotease [Helicobacter cinaedi]
MLDAMQNSILNKPDSILDKRPNSPSADVNKLESKFEDMFAKQAKAKTQKEAKDSSQAQAVDYKNPLSKALQGKMNKTEGKNTAQADSKNELLDKNLSSQPQKTQSPSTKPTSQKAQTPSAVPASFDFKDTASEDSKIGLQEKIAKSSKENKPKESNPLAEALSTPLNTGSTSTANKIAESKDSSLDSKATTPRLASMPMPQTKIPQEETQAPKTLADVQNLAQAKGLNPSKMSLETQGVNAQSLVQEALETQAKPKSIPASTKEKINYEYENNVDRIAIVQRGTKKPKNITSKISNEYPTKKANDEGKGSVFSLKDAPQLG